MVYERLRRFLFIFALLIITSAAESDFPHSDGYIEIDPQHTRFRDKRTLDFILQGLAQMLGYRLERNTARIATTPLPPPPPPPSPPTQPPTLTQTNPATPSQIVFLSLSDVDLKRKQTATELPRHAADTYRDKHYPYGSYRLGPDYIRHGHDNDSSDRYYKTDYHHVGFGDADHVRGSNEDDKNSRVGMGYSRGRGDSGHGQDGRGSDRSNYYSSRYRNDKVDEYLQRIGHYVKDQIRGGKKDKNEDKMGHKSEKSYEFNNNGASMVKDHGSEGKQNKELMKSEYGMNGSDVQHSTKVSEEQHNGGHEADTIQVEQKEDMNKGDDDDDDDKSSNEADLKSPENNGQKIVQKFQQEDSKEEPLEEEKEEEKEKEDAEEEQNKKSRQEISEKESVEQEHAHNPKEESVQKDTIDHNESEQSKQKEGTREEKHQEGAYYNQIPAPSLQTWDEDFWNGRYSFGDNNPYSFGLFDTQRSHKDEQNDLHKIPEFTFHRPSTEKDSKEFKSGQPEPYYHNPQYFDNPGFEHIHEWHVSSDRRSEKPSFDSGIHEESSESPGEFKEQQETLDGVSERPEDPSVTSAIESPQPPKPSAHGQDVTDSPPMPVHSTSKPKLAQLIHEMEGTKQNPLWPPPFDHAFESTDSSIVVHRPEQSNVTLSKKVPGHISPLLLNLYNYSSVSDYLLELSKKGLLPKQAYRLYPQYAKSTPAVQNQKSPVSYVAVVIPHQLRENSDNSVPPEPSYVGVVYPQKLLDEDTKEAFGFTSTKSDSIKNNKTPRFKPLTKSKISNVSQKAPHNNHDEIQDPPAETQYNPSHHGSPSPLMSIASSNTSAGHIHNYPDSYITPFFHNPETHSNTNTLPYSISSASGYRISDDVSQHIKDPAKSAYPNPGSTYDNPLFYNPEAGSVSNVPLQGTLLDTITSSNSSLDGNNEKLRHGVELHWPSFQDYEGSYKPIAQTEGSSSALDSRTPNNDQNEHLHDYPDTHDSSVLQNTGRNTKTNTSREESSSALNFRHPSNSSEDTYSHIKNGDVNHYPDFEYRIVQNVETQPFVSPFPYSSYNNYQNYQGNKVYNPSTFPSDGEEKLLSTKKPLRLVIPDFEPHTTPGSQPSHTTSGSQPSHTTPGSQPSHLRVVIPDFPQSELSFDYSSGNEQNELKNAAFEDNIELMTIPPPTLYGDDPGSLKNPEKWVLGDDILNSKNLKTKEYIRRVSKVHVTGKVQKQPKADQKTV